MRATLIMTAMLTALAVQARAEEPAATVKPNSYGHRLIATELAGHPEIVVMAMHAVPPGTKTNVIVASNIGRLGKAADADDLGVTSSGQAKLSVNAAGDHFEALEPLKDLDGQVIGALGVVFHYKPGDDKQARAKQAEAIRDRLSHKISHAGNLLDPWPYNPKFTGRTYAQALVEQTMARHPEVRILAIHATPPGGKTNVILGSNIGRIGKAADEDDLRVIEKGATNREVNDTGRRFEAELPLNDAKGRRIGALGVVFGYHDGEDKEALVRRAEQIRDEMAAKIASPAALAKRAG
ncbi:MAG: TonB-dependent siderophore receptor [Phenylobacterium sp.]|nr:TonB-dependent siderophore receptor [Phenylobacterium sp.]